MMPLNTSGPPELFLDVETRSACDLRKCGVHIYARHKTTALWCAAFAIDDGEIEVWLPSQPCPQAIVDHVAAGHPVWAHNSAFERLIWDRILGPLHGWPIPPLEAWGCTMARCFAAALPGSLDAVATVLGLAAKPPEGYAAMMRMAKPRKVEKQADGKLVYTWWDKDPAKMRLLIDYCKNDVAIERELHRRLLPLSSAEREVWQLDQKINDRGIQVDLALCKKILPLVEEALAKLNTEIEEVSCGIVATVNSVTQITDYCNRRGVKTDSVRAEEVERLLTDKTLPPDVKRVLEIRVEAGKASIKKVQALVTGCGDDLRARGLLQYHAASTGRWAGRRFQPQNIRRPTDTNQELLLSLLRTGSIEVVEMIAGPALETVGNVLRGLLVAKDGHRLFVADYSNIEGRVIAWLAGEEWKLDAFRAFDLGEGADIYKLAYSRAFHVNVKTVTDHQRQVGKVMELALGFGGGKGAFQTMAAGYRVEVTDKEADVLKEAWRRAHPNVVRRWAAMENAALVAVRDRETVVPCGKVAFVATQGFLYMRLPSGRLLSYPAPRILPCPVPWSDSDKRDSLTYCSALNPSNARRVIADKANGSGWGRIQTYGGAIFENSVQAIARDIMAEAMLRVEAKGYPVVLTVHDEIVAERADGYDWDFKRWMNKCPAWADGLPIVSKAWSGQRYRKD